MRRKFRLGSKLLNISFMTLFLSGCTGQVPNSFRLKQLEEIFDIANSQAFNTKVDILWVIDNSSSMNTAQDKLRSGFAQFARRYMLPTWDIRVAAIPTDVYLAHSAFNTYINSTMAGTVGYRSNYIAGRLGTYQNPSYNPTLVDLATGRFTNGVKISDQWPALGPNYARLLPGIHDGPVPALCSELHPYFYSGAANCRIRDDQVTYTDSRNCLSPSGLETAVTQCVNTGINDTVHSGKAIIETMPPSGTAGDAAWVNQLIDDFMVNASVGSWGDGSERPLGSVLQFLADNETSATAFFRPNSVRMIIFVGDEDDQTMTHPSPVPAGFTPSTYYSTVCDPKTVDGHTYTLSRCPDSTKLVAVSTIKDEFDSFFRTLDGTSTGSPNYTVAAIVPLTGAEIQSLQADRDIEDMAAVGYVQTATDRPDRILELVSSVGDGSMSLSIASNDYSPLLDSIGTTITRRRSSFQLQRAPTGQEDMVVKIYHTSGSVTILTSGQFSVSGTTLTITDVDFALTLTGSDRISINYQPRSVL